MAILSCIRFMVALAGRKSGENLIGVSLGEVGIVF